MNLSIREISKEDINSIIAYWLESEPSFLTGMGVDLSKMPARHEWEAMLLEQINQPIEEKKSYCLIWLLDGEPAGHSNVNKIIFGKEAYMHLHLWKPNLRKKGLGYQFIRLCVPVFYEKLKLEKLYCEPYALNPAPHKTLEKAGFRFVKEYVTIPGWINLEQPVKLWELGKKDLEKF